MRLRSYIWAWILPRTEKHRKACIHVISPSWMPIHGCALLDSKGHVSSVSQKEAFASWSLPPVRANQHHHLQHPPHLSCGHSMAFDEPMATVNGWSQLLKRSCSEPEFLNAKRMTVSVHSSLRSPTRPAETGHHNA